RPEDDLAVRAVHESAFPTGAEARLVERLRSNGRALVALVAEVDGGGVGSVVFSPVTVEGVAAGGLGLAPLAVGPGHQPRGVGARLVEEGLTACRRAGHGFVVLVGAPAYYGRFGFCRASELGLGNEYGVDQEFQVLELRPGALPAGGGLVRYGPE